MDDRGRLAAAARPRRRTGRPSGSSSPSWRADLELVARALGRRRGRTAPRCPSAPSERIGCRRPSQRVEVADDGDRRAPTAPRRRTRRPATPSISRDVRAELLVELLVAALAGQVQVELAERRREARTGRASVNALAVARSRPRARSAAAASRPATSPSKSPAGWTLARARPARRRRGRATTLRRAPGGTRARRRRRRAGARRAAGADRRGRGATMRLDVGASALTSGSSEQARRCRPTGMRDPVRPVVELVAQLVDRLLELEDRQQRARSAPRPAAAAPGRRPRGSPSRKRLARARPPSPPGAGAPRCSSRAAAA